MVTDMVTGSSPLQIVVYDLRDCCDLLYFISIKGVKRIAAKCHVFVMYGNKNNENRARL